MPASKPRNPETKRRAPKRVKEPKFLPNERLRTFEGGVAEIDQRIFSRSPEVYKETWSKDTAETFTECASRDGIAVSLIEGIMGMSRILWMMDLSSTAVQEALKDLRDNQEHKMLVRLETESSQGRIHDQEWRGRNASE